MLVKIIADEEVRVRADNNEIYEIEGGSYGKYPYYYPRCIYKITVSKMAFGCPCCAHSAYFYYREMRLHSFDDSPAAYTKNSTQWRYEGALHRDNDLPAYISNAKKVWYKLGKIHRDQPETNPEPLPAVVKNNGTYKEFWHNGKKLLTVSGDKVRWGRKISDALSCNPKLQIFV